jgi:hypothetical protein
MAFRTYKRHLTAADRRAKDTIAACVEGSVGIEFLPDAPRFRYDPTVAREKRTLYHGPPSGRGSIPCGKNPLKLKTWTPAKLDANPMYAHPMKGDSRTLTEARRAWANGDPGPLRQYLEAFAKRELRLADFEHPPEQQTLTLDLAA